MSKELEALDGIKIDYEFIEKNSVCDKIDNHFEGSLEEIKLLKKALEELEELKKTPTQEQVCEALSEYFRQEVVYNRSKAFIFINPNNNIYAYSGRVVWKNGGNIRFEYDLPHDLVVLVGKFFKGVIENGNNS
ncbi:MAG: hypothetical protein M0Q88_00220 [Bacilli bacterium]|nr:hypothetical protein [Bacilli bacterium]